MVRTMAEIASADPAVSGRKDFEAQNAGWVGTLSELELGGRSIWPRMHTFPLIMKVLMLSLSLPLPGLLILRFLNCLLLKKINAVFLFFCVCVRSNIGLILQ